MEFEWKFVKEAENIKNHRVNFAEAMEAFSDPNDGANLGDFIMKQPKISELKFDAVGTQRLRQKMKKAKKIRITINIDSDLMENLKGNSAKTGVPYQTLLNRLLRQAIDKTTESDTRILRLEKEIKGIKKQLAI